MLKRFVIFTHRWLGVPLCLVFLLWFPSGIVMMYWGFPSVTAGDRLKRSPVLDPTTIVVSPEDAYATLELEEPPRQATLNSFDGRPVYRFRLAHGEAVVYADTREERIDVSSELMGRVAAAWSGQPLSEATVESLDEVDQWTLQGVFRDLGPLSKFSWPDGQQVYVSAGNGEVVQYTTKASRFWAYIGAIPHWLYFTPLRKHGPQWNAVVTWSSGIGTIAVCLGIVAGVWMYSPARIYRYDGMPSSVPYRGYKRWHMIFGLIFGIGAATWAFSGMLSMDPFPLSRSEPPGGGPDAGALLQRAVREPLDVATFISFPPRQALAGRADLSVKELELVSFPGRPAYLATLADGETRVLPFDGTIKQEFDRERLIELITNATRALGLAEIRVLTRYDAYYLDRRRERPLPVLRVRFNDREQSRYYVDPKTALVVGSHRISRWMTRWLYHGLHSLDFPWLYDYRPLWDIVVITFMLGGTALAVTSVVLASNVLSRRSSRH
jgi:PepSY-associated transmembrane protein